MTSRNILVTGGAGFIGSNFVHAVHADFDSVYVLDRLNYAGDRSNLEPITADVEFVEGDVRDRKLVDELYDEVDVVVNFAAESHVDRSIEGGFPFVEHNVLGAYTLMDAIRDADVDRFIQISTDEVYGSIRSGEFSEDDPLDPSSPYSASKASADHFVNACWETYGLPITVVRPTNVFGPRQHTEKLIPKFTLRALRGEPLPVYGDGSNVRQWLYVSDLCRAIRQIIDHASDDVFNVAGTGSRTNLQVTKDILERTGESEDLIEFVDDRKGHDQRYALSDQKLRDEVGFEPAVDFEDGLDRTVEWYRSERDHFE